MLQGSVRIGRSERAGRGGSFVSFERAERGTPMAPRRARVRNAGSTRYSGDTVGRTQSSKNKAGQTYQKMDVFDFTGTSEKDEEPYETFDPPLHSTAIYADEEVFSAPSGPSSPQGKEAKRNSDTSETEASENESLKLGAKKTPRRKHKPVIDKSESSDEFDGRSQVKPVEKTNTHHQTPSARASSRLAGAPAQPATDAEEGALSDGSAVEREAREGGSPAKVRKKMSRSKKKKSKNEDSDTADYAHAWCLEGQSRSDITELGVILSAFEDVCLKYKENIESKIFKETISKFHSHVKEELIKMLKEAQKVKTLKRKNAKIISDIEKKRQHLIEVQDELLRLEPQLKQLQTKYDELQERKAALSNAVYFLSNLKHIHDYSDFQEKKKNMKKTYDSSSLPALLFKARTLWRAETHLQSINHHLETLLDQEQASKD